ncbi:MAG: ATPase, partial [Bradyrhizobium sp.]
GFVEGSKFYSGISKGWPAILSSLKSILETGQPLDIPFEALKIEA